MITITKEDDHFIFEVKGMHKLWAFKSQLTIPIAHIIEAYQDEASMHEWKGWRMPGTSMPYFLTAGTFYKSGNKIFWDVMDEKKSIIIDLQDEEYKQLIIEVEDPQAAIKLLTGGSL